MKKLFTFLLCFVFLLGAFGLVGCGETVTESKTEQNNIEKAPRAQLSVQSVSAPRIGGKVLTAYSTRSGQTGISKRLSATVEPATAQNKLVDYMVFWADEGEHAEEPVTDYVIVEQDSDGSTDATVTCIQAFGDDTVIIQVVTRDGGFRAHCMATYVGIASSMDISAPSGVTTASTAARGNYYELYTNTTYNFSVRLTNAIGNAKAKDLIIESQGWSGGDETYHTGAIISKTSQFAASWDYERTGERLYKRSILPENFFSVNLSDTGVSIIVNSTIVESYSEYNAAGAILYGTDLYLATFINSAGLSYLDDTTYNRIVENEALLATRYFYVTIKDNVSNISETIKFWINSSADSVALSAQNLEF